MIVVAWFLAVTLANGDVKVVNEPFASLSDCLEFERIVTKDYVKTQCFHGPMLRALPAQF